MSRVGIASLFGVLGLLTSACGGADVHVSTGPAPATSASAPPPADSSAPPDVLGPRPIPGASSPWQPPQPVVYQTPSGITVWLLERHSLPVVAVTVSIPNSAS
jgi:hypothetical protein